MEIIDRFGVSRGCVETALDAAENLARLRAIARALCERLRSVEHDCSAWWADELAALERELGEKP